MEIVNLNTTKKERYVKGLPSKNRHIGQRKLLLSEIQVLTEFYKNYFVKDHPTVLYIGAAPGIHLVTLSRLFPHVKFVLYDGASFYPPLLNDKIFEIYNEYVDDDTVHKFKQKRIDKGDTSPLIFLCDIRLSGEDEEAFEAGVTRDMDLQKGWVHILQPDLSMLKFRMSYAMKHGNKLTYLQGTLYYGIWAKKWSGETRLMVTKEDITYTREYDYKDYEETLFYHNKYTRELDMRKDEQYKKYIDEFREYLNGKPYKPMFDYIVELIVLSKYSAVMKHDLHKVIKVVGPITNTFQPTDLTFSLRSLKK